MVGVSLTTHWSKAQFMGDLEKNEELDGDVMREFEDDSGPDPQGLFASFFSGIVNFFGNFFR